MKTIITIKRIDLKEKNLKARKFVNRGSFTRVDFKGVINLVK